MTNPQKRALIIIDVQKGFDDPRWGKRNNPQAEENIAILLALWRSVQGPIFHIKNDSTEANSPLRPGMEGNKIKDIVAPLPGERVFIKTVNSAFIGTTLQADLNTLGIKDLVIAGLTTDHCVSTTIRMGANLGFNCSVVEDATATFDRKGYNGKKYSAEEIHEMGLVSLQDEFAKIIKTSDLIGEINVKK